MRDQYRPHYTIQQSIMITQNHPVGMFLTQGEQNSRDSHHELCWKVMLLITSIPKAHRKLARCTESFFFLEKRMH